MLIEIIICLESFGCMVRGWYRERTNQKIGLTKPNESIHRKVKMESHKHKHRVGNICVKKYKKKTNKPLTKAIRDDRLQEPRRIWPKPRKDFSGWWSTSQAKQDVQRLIEDRWWPPSQANQDVRSLVEDRWWWWWWP